MAKQLNSLLKAIAALSTTLYFGYSHAGAVISIPEVKHDVSLALDGLIEQHHFKTHLSPEQKNPYIVPLHKTPLKLSEHVQDQKDKVIQLFSGLPLPTIDGLNLVGIGYDFPNYTNNSVPPDPNASVGDTQVVQWVNTSFAIFNKKTGAIISGAINGNILWTGFGGPCEQQNSGDPIVRYDQLANRWVFTQFAVEQAPYMQCVAVSKTSDARGPYYRYAYNFGTNFNDYGKLGVWPDAYYMSFDMYANSKPEDDFNASTLPTKTGPAACALDRLSMLRGAPARPMQCFQPQPATGLFLPSDLDGKTLPPTGLPNYFVGLSKDAEGAISATNLALWKFHVNWASPPNSSFVGPIKLKVAPFNPKICDDVDGICIPQKGTSYTLDALSDRMMYRLAYRNFGRYQSMVVNHTVKVGPNTAGIRWYEIRINSAGTPGLYQQGTYTQNDGNSRWMGSIAMDKVGNLALGYSVSGATYPTIRYTGRHPTDALNTMRMEKTIINGSGYQSTSSPTNRWGDYSSMAIDPIDDCTFWYTTEYIKTTGDLGWGTRIASFKFPSCR